MALAQMAPDNRPPFIEFIETAIEDRNETIAQGRLVMKPQEMVVIRQIGSKDSIEFIADEWLKQQETLAMSGRLPPEWAALYRAKYKAWKDGKEGPVNGFPIRDWPSVNRAMAENLIALGVVAVEDLANANEPTLERIGMGARALQQKAKAFLESTKGTVNHEELAGLRAQLSDRDERISDLEKRLAALEQKKK